MTQQFKVLTYRIPTKEIKKDFQPHEFEKLVNDHLQQGWKVINCESIFMGSVNRYVRHYRAYIVKD